LLQDVADFIQEVVTSATPLPVILCACSWGGKLAAAFCRRHPDKIDGLALLCPGMFPKVGLPFSERIRILGSRLVAPSRRFPIPLNAPSLFTAMPRWREFIATDPLSLRQATARFFVESVRLDWYLRGVPRHVTVPTLLMLAEHDQIIDNERTRRFVQSFAAPDKQIIEFAGAQHTLEFEPEPDRFIDELIHWLRKHERGLVHQGHEQPAEVVRQSSLNLGTC
jgi:alpha-beta hydrolase superfamily lysophospholipase